MLGGINRYFSDIKCYLSQKCTGGDQAAIQFGNKQVIFYQNETSNIYSILDQHLLL